jgi:spore coat protein U-like protein
MQVPITDPDMPMMEAIGAALAAHGSTAEGLYSNYISSINGLAEKQGTGTHSGWMGTLNGWFVSESFSSFAVQNGDVVRVMYSNADSGGTDLGGTWLNNDKSLFALGLSAGALTPPFSSGTSSYTLTLPAGTNSVTVTPEAVNKNFQVRVKAGAESFGNVRWGPRTLSVTDGGTITVTCGCVDPLWPSMNNGPDPGAYAESVPAVTYTIAVDIEGTATVLKGDINGNGRINAADLTLMMRFLAGLAPLADTQLMAADVNSNSRVNAADLTLMMRYLAGLIGSLGS